MTFKVAEVKEVLYVTDQPIPEFRTHSGEKVKFCPKMSEFKFVFQPNFDPLITFWEHFVPHAASFYLKP